MKILHLIYDDLANPWLGGGAAVRTYEVYRKLAKKHDITVVTGNYPGAKKEERKDGILYKRIGCGRTYLSSRLTFLMGIPGMVRSDYDILVEDFSAPSPYFSPAYNRRPVIALVQMIFSPLYFKKRLFLAGPTILLQKLGFRYYKNFIAVAGFVGDKIRVQNKNASICVIPNGIDLRDLSYPTGEKNYILYLGRIDYHDKGLDVLIKSFDDLTKKYPVKLVIAGGGRDKEIRKVEESIRNIDSIDFIGKVSGEKKREYLANCLFLCIPSRNEACPIVTLEAMSFGKPIVASSVGGLTEIIKKCEGGLLARPGDAGELSRQIVRLLESEKLRRELGGHGKSFAERHTWDAIAKRQEEYYKTVLSQYEIND